MTESVLDGVHRTRRAILAAAAGGATALAVSAIRPSVAEAAPGNMQTETDNATTADTGVTNSTDGDLALFGHATGAGTGVEGTSGKGFGVVGTSADTTDPVGNVRNTGVAGIAGAIGSIADNTGLTGVYGYSDPSAVPDYVGAGVWGDSPDFGVVGTGAVGAFGYGSEGVLGIASNGSGIGVVAAVDVASARALRVEGRAEFTRSGRTTIGAGKSTKAVALAGCTTSTLVLAVLATSRPGRWVRAVVPAAGKFTIYLNTTVASTTAITWIAFTNPANHSG